MTPGLPLQAASTAKASSTGGFSVPGRRVVSPFSSVVRTGIVFGNSYGRTVGHAQRGFGFVEAVV